MLAMWLLSCWTKDKTQTSTSLSVRTRIRILKLYQNVSYLTIHVRIQKVEYSRCGNPHLPLKTFKWFWLWFIFSFFYFHTVYGPPRVLFCPHFDLPTTNEYYKDNVYSGFWMLSKQHPVMSRGYYSAVVWEAESIYQSATFTIFSSPFSTDPV